MSQKDTLHLAQEFLARMGGGGEPAEIAKLSFARQLIVLELGAVLSASLT
jgi:hypothetical protein